ncbi:hypothetical protein TCARB_1085 [Thermofilum adornatum 1505]|uniref:Uncharacterized protein n=1 Tax=Thermofilum adornatum 1505 TaxID=697581 RepID=A0A3G1A7D7_9CREN|nr:hypothetical protein TCARB_1085 [Thermofilum adornatum 1505]
MNQRNNWTLIRENALSLFIYDPHLFFNVFLLGYAPWRVFKCFTFGVIPPMQECLQCL